MPDPVACCFASVPADLHQHACNNDLRQGHMKPASFCLAARILFAQAVSCSADLRSRILQLFSHRLRLHGCTYGFAVGRPTGGCARAVGTEGGVWRACLECQMMECTLILRSPAHGGHVCDPPLYAVPRTGNLHHAHHAFRNPSPYCWALRRGSCVQENPYTFRRSVKGQLKHCTFQLGCHSATTRPPPGLQDHALLSYVHCKQALTGRADFYPPKR